MRYPQPAQPTMPTGPPIRGYVAPVTSLFAPWGVPGWAWTPVEAYPWTLDSWIARSVALTEYVCHTSTRVLV